MSCTANIANSAELGAALRAARRARGLRLEDAALGAGVGARFLSELERGKPTCALGETLRVAASLGLRSRLRTRMTDRTLESGASTSTQGCSSDSASGLEFAYAELACRRACPRCHSRCRSTAPIRVAPWARSSAASCPRALRATSARILGVSVDNDFALLAALGGDTAGAISLLAPGEIRQDRSGRDVEWLDDRSLPSCSTNFPSRPLHADEDGEYRLSLAGAQDKLPVVVDADGRIGLTKGRTPSTHVLKTPIAARRHVPTRRFAQPSDGCWASRRRRRRPSASRRT